MRIMPAGMHDARVAGAVFCSRLLLDRQGVHIRPQQNRPAFPASVKEADNPAAEVAADMPLHFKTILLKQLGYHARSSRNIKQHLRMLMNIPANQGKLLLQCIDVSKNRRCVHQLFTFCLAYRFSGIGTSRFPLSVSAS
ncbi:hypothetical protein D3C81_1215460 [compost metagenome]